MALYMISYNNDDVTHLCASQNNIKEYILVSLGGIYAL